MFHITENLIKENTTEQLDETFDELTKAISLRSGLRGWAPTKS
jgi:hypothetical protein